MRPSHPFPSQWLSQSWLPFTPKSSLVSMKQDISFLYKLVSYIRVFFFFFFHHLQERVLTEMAMHKNCLCSSSLVGAVCYTGNLQNLRKSACRCLATFTLTRQQPSKCPILCADEETEAQSLAHKLGLTKHPGEDANPGGYNSESYQPPKGAG